jgi:hypothetical protein
LVDDPDELDELDPVSVLGDVDGLVELRGGGGVGAAGLLGRRSGDAEGDVRSRSVPPTRSLLSVQPASTPAPSARTHTPVSSFFMVVPPRGFDPRARGAMGVPPTARLRYAERLAATSPARDDIP